ncbi:expressed unknown protein [Seminavis robusta]|uniref:Uncharacterized protein n=1 Tax=Seminavis robusta TaxID=568900 RepID=A0A9N8DNN5_9STRA|nr:expressed unknown protein [Seminavis robusta]|eukprot:Sro248_g098490.1 n/a (153) ;mRNA; f:78201-78659
MTGHPNGCYASFGMAMQHSDLVAAMACMTGHWVPPPATNYTPVPIWALHGARDIIAPTNRVDLLGAAYVPAKALAFDRLSALHECTNNNVTTTEDAVPEMDVLLTGRGTLTTQTATSCPHGATVEFVTLSTAGHIAFPAIPEFLPLPPFATS